MLSAVPVPMCTAPPLSDRLSWTVVRLRVTVYWLSISMPPPSLVSSSPPLISKLSMDTVSGPAPPKISKTLSAVPAAFITVLVVPCTVQVLL